MMTGDWLSQKYRFEIGNDSVTPRLVVMRDIRLPTDTVGFLTRTSDSNGTVLTLICPNLNTLRGDNVSKLLALAILDSEVTLLQPTQMPSRNAHAIVKADGQVRHQLIRLLSEWALSECEKLSTVLHANHGQLLNAIIKAILNRSDTTFADPPANSLLIFSPGSAFTIEPLSIKVDTSGFERQYGGLERYKILQLEYMRDRYMAHLSHDYLMTRVNDVMRNIHQVDKKGRITLEGSPRLYYWMDRFTEILQEAQVRRIPQDVFGKAATEDYPFPVKTELPKRVGKAVEESDIPTGDYLVRYGNYEHIVDAFERGYIRLGPASSYADPSLNPAIKDEELVFNIDMDTEVFRVFGPSAVNVGRRHSIQGTLNTNFYILCTSSNLKARHFLDFNYDACLVINNPDAFKERLASEISRILPSYSLQAERVEYYDPLWVSPAELRPPFWKHFRYAYQEEVRFAAIPDNPKGSLDPLFLELGSLEDISTIVDAR